MEIMTDSPPATDSLKKDGLDHAENGVSEEDNENLEQSDSMPDLIWPEKKSSSAVKENDSTITSSESQDTGFGSNNASEASSPDDATKSFEESLSQETNDDTKDEEKGSEKKEEKTEEQDGMDILGNGLLIKRMIVPGKGVGTRPKNGDTVTLKVDGVLEDGGPVDTGEISFILNDGDVILAFDIAVALMEADEKCELTTAARYAYGSTGRVPDIPKDAAITYTLELVNVQPAVEFSALSYEQRLKMGDAKRERGNYLFGRGDFSGAINSYSKGLKVLDDPDLNVGLDEACRCQIGDLSVKCYNNMAACQLKINALDAAIRSCEKVLSVQENNVKALFRLSKAYSAKGEVEEALTHLRCAIKLDPESKMLHQEMLHLTRRRNKETASEKELYQRMLGVKPGSSQAKTAEKSNPLLKWTLVASGVAAVLVSVGFNWYRFS